MSGAERERLKRIAANLERRALVHRAVRRFFEARDFLEVDTPIRAPAIAPEKEITPFGSDGWFLATSPELYMKRLLAAGYQRLFQVSHCFRKGERGRLHNPEFSLLEWYRAGASYKTVIEDTQQLVLVVSAELGLGDRIGYQGSEVELRPPWPAVTVRDLYSRIAGWDPVLQPDSARFDEDMVTKIMPCLNAGRPTVVTEYPAALASLARLKADDPAVAERAEVFVGGLELANAYSELNDPAEQRARFERDARTIEREQGREAPLPESFLASVEGMPECAGIALGLDRLVMLFCNAAAIDDVLPFTVDTA